jgi:hypothetical protein
MRGRRIAVRFLETLLLCAEILSRAYVLGSVLVACWPLLSELNQPNRHPHRWLRRALGPVMAGGEAVFDRVVSLQVRLAMELQRLTDFSRGPLSRPIGAALGHGDRFFFGPPMAPSAWGSSGGVAARTVWLVLTLPLRALIAESLDESAATNATLRIAVGVGAARLTGLLVRLDADPTEKDENGGGVMALAIRRKRRACAEALASWSETNDLHDAVAAFGARNAPECLRELVRDEKRAWYRLCAAARAGDALRVGQLLGRRRIEPDAARQIGLSYAENSALRIAAAGGHIACVELLMPHCDPHATTSDGCDALMHAATAGHADCVESLLAHSDARATDSMGSTALMRAACHGHADCVRLLLSHSNGSAVDHQCFTALMYAAAGGYADCVERLVPHSDALAVTKNGETALMWAARNGCVDCVAALLPASDATMRNHDYVAAIGLAVQAGHAECADLLAPYSDRGDANTAFKTLGPQKMPRWLAQIESEALRRTVGECAGAATAAAGTDPNHTPKARGASKRL